MGLLKMVAQSFAINGIGYDYISRPCGEVLSTEWTISQDRDIEVTVSCNVDTNVIFIEVDDVIGTEIDIRDVTVYKVINLINIESKSGKVFECDGKLHVACVLKKYDRYSSEAFYNEVAKKVKGVALLSKEVYKKVNSCF